MNSDIWQFKNNICRCCHAEGLFFNLAEPRSFDGEIEVYVDMIKYIFNIKMRPIPGAMCELTYTICMPCIIKLREAIQFKNQVQSCEDKFIDLCLNNKLKVLVFEKTDTAKVNKEVNKDVKEEYLVLENDLDRNNDADPDFDANDEDVKEEQMALENDIGRNNDADPENPNEQEMESEDDVVISTKSEKRKEEVNPEETETVSVRTLMQEAEKKNVPVKKKVGKSTKFRLQPGDYKKTGDIYKCSKCDKEFNKKVSLRFHVKSKHYKIPSFICELCKKEFMTIAPFTIHKFEEHNIDDRYKCNACRAMFNSKIQLRKHTNNFHMLGEKYKHESVKDSQEEKASPSNAHAIVETSNSSFETSNANVLVPETPESCIEKNNTLKPRLSNFIRNDQSKNDSSSLHLNKETRRLSDELTRYAEQIARAVSSDALIGPSESKDLDVPNQENTEDIDIPSPEKTTTKHRKRIWNRRNCCFYCEKLVTNFTRHLFRRHSKEPEVLKIKAIKDSDPKIQRRKRQAITNDMRNHGNYIHNRKVVSNKEGQLLTARRTNNEVIKPQSASSFVVCKNCLGTFKRSTFFMHSKKCGGEEAESNRYLARNSMRIIPDLKNASIVVVPEAPESCIEKNNKLKPRLSNLIRNDQRKNDSSSLHLNKETSRLSVKLTRYAEQIALAVSSDALIGPSESKDLDVPNQENTEDIEIPLPEKTTTKRSKRSWNRRNCCFYCEKLVTNFTRHLFKHHSKEPEVLKIKAIKDSDPKIQRRKRQAITNDMRNHGNYIHNSKVVSNKEGQLLTARRTNNEAIKPQSASSFVVCKNCLGTYKRLTFFKHSKKCGGDDAEPKCYLTRNSMRIIPDLKNASKELIKNRLTRLKNDDISRIAKNDPLNSSFGCIILKNKKKRRSRKSGCS